MSRKRIVSVLEERPCTFRELIHRTLLSRSVLSSHLKELEEEGLIEREYKPQPKGRGKILIMLSPKAREDVEKTLRQLEHLAPPPWYLDLQLGRTLLTKGVVQTVIEIVKNSFRPIGMVGPAPPFDKFTLLKGLAIYDWEKNRLPLSLTQASPEELKSPGSPEFYLARELRKKSSDVLVALPLVRDRGLVEKFDKLLEWIGSIQHVCDEKTYFLSQRIQHHSVLYRWAEEQVHAFKKKPPRRGGGEKN